MTCNFLINWNDWSEFLLKFSLLVGSFTAILVYNLKLDSFFRIKISKFSFLKFKPYHQDWPSPPRIPIFGSLLFIIGSDFCQKCWEWRKKHGEIFKLKLGTSSESLMVCGAEVAWELLVTRGSSFKTRNNQLFYAKELRLAEFFPPAMTTTPHVIIQRQLLINSIRMAISQGEGNCIDRASRHFLSQLQRNLNLGSKPIEPKEILLECSAVCAINIGFGFRWTPQDLSDIPEAKKILESTKLIFEMLEAIHEPTIPFPILVSWLSGRTERLRKRAEFLSNQLLGAHETLFRAAKRAVEADENSLEPSAARTLLTSEKNVDLSEFEKYCLAGTSMASASTTTSNALISMIGCLAAFPEWQIKAQKEIDGYVGRNSDSLAEFTLPSSNPRELEQLPILKAIVDETLRLFPVFPLLDRIADEDILLSDGRLIREGQRVFFVYHNINRDPSMYEDPEEFRPDRFLKNYTGEIDQEKGKFMWGKYGHSSFSGGRRACPGSQFALHKSMCFLSRLIYCFEFKFKNSERVGLKNLKTYQTGVERITRLPELNFEPRRPNLDLHLGDLF